MNRLHKRLRENAASLLAPGEQIQAVIPAQLGQPGPQAAPVLHKMALIATDRRILVCEGAWFRRSTIRKVLVELPRDTQIGPAHGVYGYAFRPGNGTIPIWIPRQFYKDIAEADDQRIAT